MGESIDQLRLTDAERDAILDIKNLPDRVRAYVDVDQSVVSARTQAFKRLAAQLRAETDMLRAAADNMRVALEVEDLEDKQTDIATLRRQNTALREELHQANAAALQEHQRNLQILARDQGEPSSGS